MTNCKIFLAKYKNIILVIIHTQLHAINGCRKANFCRLKLNRITHLANPDYKRNKVILSVPATFKTLQHFSRHSIHVIRSFISRKVTPPFEQRPIITMTMFKTGKVHLQNLQNNDKAGEIAFTAAVLIVAGRNSGLM